MAKQPGKSSRKTFDYAKRADECMLHAAVSKNDRAREVWETMEKYWRKRAAAGQEASLVPEPPAKQDAPNQPAKAKPERTR